MNDHARFRAECDEEIARQGADPALRELSHTWLLKAAEYKYSYHFEWLGRPIIQHPQDILAMQMLLWEVQPDLVIETGIARGGSLIFTASMLELIAQCGGPADAKVLGIDIDIRAHNRDAILAHPLAKRVQMIEGSSTAREVVDAVRDHAGSRSKILVCLDSNHTHEHVLAELEAYAPLVTRGSYCVVFDTVIADMPADAFPDRPWTKTANPKTAVHAFLDHLRVTPTPGADGAPLAFTIDRRAEDRLLLTVAPDGFLRRT